MILPSGWFDWAERVPGASNKVNGWQSPASGFIAHSAEGWEDYLRRASINPDNRKSWHLSVTLDGRLLQHYSIYAQCWSSGHPVPNNNFVALEAEGTKDGPLTPPQLETVVRVLHELSIARRWVPSRVEPRTLHEHREWSATACPSGRYPWDEILARLGAPPPGGDELSEQERITLTLLREYQRLQAALLRLYVVKPGPAPGTVELVDVRGGPPGVPTGIVIPVE